MASRCFAAATGWAYSRWDYRRAVQSTVDKVHFAVQFTRYRKDGIANVYGLVREQGRGRRFRGVDIVSGQDADHTLHGQGR